MERPYRTSAGTAGRRYGLDGTVTIVTGASRGIGAGIARCILAAGGAVLGVARTRRSDRPADDDGYRFLEIDLLQPDAADRALAAALEAFGQVDALVNNAGAHLSAPAWLQTDAEWDHMVGVNVTAAFLLSQAVARHWVASQTAGVIVNVGSVECEVGWNPPPQAAYAATKGALLGLTRALALEWAAHRIRVNAVGPGAASTDMTTPFRADIEARIPLGHHFAEVHHVGDATVFLLSDAAEYITGEIVYVDGGYRLQ